MIRFFVPLMAVLLMFSCCKSNEKAYQAAYEKMKDREAEITKEEEADMMAGNGPETLIKRAPTTNLKVNESVTVVAGDAKNLSKYNIVLKSFINRTNAKSLYDRLVKEGNKAVLVQNVKKEYRVVVESCKYEYEADKIAADFRKVWPETWILVRY